MYKYHNSGIHPPTLIISNDNETPANVVIAYGNYETTDDIEVTIPAMSRKEVLLPEPEWSNSNRFKSLTSNVPVFAEFEPMFFTDRVQGPWNGIISGWCSN